VSKDSARGRRLTAPRVALSLALLATAALAAAGPRAAWARTAATMGFLDRPRGFSAEPAALQRPPRLARNSLALVPALVTGESHPELVYAQRAIDRGMNGPPVTPAEPMSEVDIEGWKSVGRAGASSLLIPGTGQLYVGQSRGYVFLGVEALALVGYATFKSKGNDQRDEYYSYVGDPNQPDSRFSFERYAASADPAEVDRLRTIYEKDKSEFYDQVTINAKYSTGWSDPDDRYDARAVAEDAEKSMKRANNSLYILIANHLVSAVDALNLARFNNIALRENLSLKLKLRPGLRHSSYGLALTQRF
jgi:hypothetical protein